MIKKIITTVFSRIILSGIGFAIVVLTSRYLGASGKGDVSLFVLNMTIVQLINNFVGGSFIAYLLPRRNFMHLFFISYVWAAVTSVLIPALLFIFKIIPYHEVFLLMYVSFLFSLFSIHIVFFVGKEEIRNYNFITLFQSLLLICIFLYFIKFKANANYLFYVDALFYSVTAAVFVSLFLLAKYFHRFSFNGIGEVFKEAIKGGFMLQLGNIAQMLNYRLSFFILDMDPDGRSQVGIYSVAVQIGEALWLVGHSAGLVLYSKVTNLKDSAYAKRLTIALVKIVLLITALIMTVVLFLPALFYEFVFGNGFGDVKPCLLPLSVGIVILSAGILFSSYFVGIGKTQVSTVASVIGLVITLVLSFILIPEYGMIGAAITASISYSVGVVYQFLLFIREPGGNRFSDFLFRKSDFTVVINELRNSFSIQRN